MHVLFKLFNFFFFNFFIFFNTNQYQNIFTFFIFYITSIIFYYYLNKKIHYSTKKFHFFILHHHFLLISKLTTHYSVLFYTCLYQINLILTQSSRHPDPHTIVRISRGACTNYNVNYDSQ
jgi:hypothetical protein